MDSLGGSWRVIQSRAFFFAQDITIRRLEDVIARYEEGAEEKVEEATAARALEVQEVRATSVGVIEGAGS